MPECHSGIRWCSSLFRNISFHLLRACVQWLATVVVSLISLQIRTIWRWQGCWCCLPAVECTLKLSHHMTLRHIILGVRVAEWLSHSAVVQEVPGSNPGDAESVGQWRNYCKYLSLWVYLMFSTRAYSLFRFVLIKLRHWGEPSACI